MSDEQEFKDFVAFLDDNDEKRELWVNVIEINSFVKFITKTGKIISIPGHRVLKVKQEANDNDN